MLVAKLNIIFIIYLNNKEFIILLFENLLYSGGSL